MATVADTPYRDLRQNSVQIPNKSSEYISRIRRRNGAFPKPWLGRTAVPTVMVGKRDPSGSAPSVNSLYADQNGLCLFAKRLERGRFVWPTTRTPGATVVLTPAEVSLRLEGLDWRHTIPVSRPTAAG